MSQVPRVSVHSVSVHSLVLAFVDSFLHCCFFSLKQFPSHEMYGYDWGRARTIQNQNVDIFWGNEHPYATYFGVHQR